MELRHLRYFITVAEELHFTRAAERLNMGQPPLSQQIQALEKEMGVELFERTKRKVALTTAGKCFFEEAQHILDQVKIAVDKTQRIAHGELGELRLGFTASFPMTSLLPNILYEYRQCYPNVTLRLKEMYTPDQFNALLHNKIDVGIVRSNEPTAPEGISMITLRRDPLLLVVHKHHPFAELPSISLAQCKDESFIAYPSAAGTLFRRYVQQLCKKAGFEQRIVQEAGEAVTKISLVATGLGITVLPSPIDSLRIEGVRYIPLSDEDAYLMMSAATREHENSLLVFNFLNQLKRSISINK